MDLGILIGPFPTLRPRLSTQCSAPRWAEPKQGKESACASCPCGGAGHPRCAHSQSTGRVGGGGGHGAEAGRGAAWQPPWGSGEQPPASGTGAAGGGPWAALQRVRTSRPICAFSFGHPKRAFRLKGCGWFEGKSDNCGRLLGQGPLVTASRAVSLPLLPHAQLQIVQRFHCGTQEQLVMKGGMFGFLACALDLGLLGHLEGSAPGVTPPHPPLGPLDFQLPGFTLGGRSLRLQGLICV